MITPFWLSADEFLQNLVSIIQVDIGGFDIPLVFIIIAAIVVFIILSGIIYHICRTLKIDCEECQESRERSQVIVPPPRAAVGDNPQNYPINLDGLAPPPECYDNIGGPGDEVCPMIVGHGGATGVTQHSVMGAHATTHPINHRELHPNYGSMVYRDNNSSSLRPINVRH